MGIGELAFSIISNGIYGVLVLVITYFIRLAGMRSRFSPSVGLANGYYENFLKHVVEGFVREEDIRADIKGKTVSLKKRKLYIYLTDTASDSSSESLLADKQRIKEERGIEIIEARLDLKPRAKTLDCLPKPEDPENSVLFDYPTTVSVIPEIIRRRYRGTPFVNREKALLKIEVEELKLFQQTLEELVSSRHARFIEFTSQDVSLLTR